MPPDRPPLHLRAMRLERGIKAGEAHVPVPNIGPAGDVDIRIESLDRTHETARSKATVI
jgi:hypothetical protein